MEAAAKRAKQCDQVARYDAKVLQSVKTCARAPCNVTNCKQHSTRVFCSFLVGILHAPSTLKEKATSIQCYVAYVHIDWKRLHAYHACCVSVACCLMLQTTVAQYDYFPLSRRCLHITALCFVSSVQHISLSVLRMQYRHLQGFQF